MHNILNFANGVLKTEFYIDIDNKEIPTDFLENLKTITNGLKLLSNYIDDFCEVALAFDREECIIWDNSEDWNLYESTCKIATQCSGKYWQIKSLGESFKADYKKNIELINSCKTHEYNDIKGIYEVNTRIDYFANEWNIFMISVN